MPDLNFQQDNEIYGVLFPALLPVEKAIKRQTGSVESRYYTYEPGNMTRYDVIFNVYDAGWGPEMVMTIINLNTAMVIPSRMHSPTQISYLKDKLGLGEGDCYALMQLINYHMEKAGY